MAIVQKRVAALVMLAGVGTASLIGYAQDDEEAESASPNAQVADSGGTIDEEIVVRGRSLTILRQQLRLAEEAVFARFNEINSDDQFDIHCYEEAPTGSRIRRRLCHPNFWRTAQASAGQEALLAMQGMSALPPEMFVAEAVVKREQLAEEMRRLAMEDEELMQALTRLSNVSAALNQRSIPVRRAADATFDRERAAEDSMLPYDASRVVDVLIGREPWRYELTSRTFTIAQLYGEIFGLDVDCVAGGIRLQWETGAEWTLPDDWGACTLQVQASRGTSFALYEFD